MHRALAHLARLALVLAGCASASAFASAAPPPAEAFFRPADFKEVALSPSGRYLALTSAKGQLSTSEQQLVTLKDQVSKLIDIDNSVMSVADAIAGLQSAISALDGLGGGSDAFDPSTYWSK